MSKCDERFARQYRYEPPPGFPLASPSSDIVHHLSGPNRCAYTQTSLRKLKSVVTTKIITVTFTTHIPFHGTYSHTCVDSLVRVSRRVIWNLWVPMPWETRALQHNWTNDRRMRFHTDPEVLCKNMRLLRKTKFTSDINQPKHSRSVSNRVFGWRFSCIGNQRQIPRSQNGCANPAKKKDPSACNTVVSGAYNPLFKVLCIFPSRYLFAIGLEKIFSFRWNIPSN